MTISVRKNAIAEIAAGDVCSSEGFEKSISEFYGEDVFNLKTMREFLPRDVYKKLLATIKKGSTLDSTIADSVANAMKRWAINKGASHYSHWFQPLTSTTAEKHDSFIEPDNVGGVVMDFSGSNLIKGEPDASSFPSGGLRATFEARGYTAWDPTSPAFIKRNSNGATLCIPTVFCSYTGEALDKKTPLLRSIDAVSVQAGRLLNLLGIELEERIIPTLGAEQEYFLVDKKLASCRPDLVQTGRTLFGNMPQKHQQLSDHYFGSIKRRVLDFMTAVDHQLWKLGIPAKTRHNEVSPAQFELAAQFETLNLAVDHNMLIMEVLRDVADQFGFECLMHEKPFAGVNGSGKHNNWSLNGPGINMLKPGKNPRENKMFLATLCAVIKAVDTHADLLRSTSASAGNDHRLGGHEAPPAIISMYLGEELTAIVDQLENGVKESLDAAKKMHIGTETLPQLSLDNSDRNRTSPFAFTGNKFEFRAVGAEQSCANANIILNTIVAEALDEICTDLEALPADKFEEGFETVLGKVIKGHKRIIFNGDNYTQEWVEEAARRGLPNLVKTPEAIKTLIAEKAVKLFEKYNVMTKTELECRHDVYLDVYDQVVAIEGGVALEMAESSILFAALNQLEKLYSLTSKGCALKTVTGLVEKIENSTEKLSTNIESLRQALETKESLTILDAMQELRATVDCLELCIDDEIWPLPKYNELLFVY
ncbi:glutamine synthetase III [Lentisphaerota bacterium WC36G]|nr:glutamine synthetase III [Lentisphaerae bacterium WC36]